MSLGLASRQYGRGNRTPRALSIVRRIYRFIEVVLWVLLAVFVAGALSIIPQIPEIRARGERRLAAEISGENRQFCERRGLTLHSEAYEQCIFDLDAVRKNQTRRISEAMDF